MSRSLLVTGAAGFIGANFVHYWTSRAMLGNAGVMLLIALYVGLIQQRDVAVLSLLRQRSEVHAGKFVRAVILDKQFIQPNRKRQTGHHGDFTFDQFDLVPKPGEAAVDDTRNQDQNTEMCGDDSDQRIAPLVFQDHWNVHDGNKQQADAIECQQAEVPPGLEKVGLRQKAADNGNDDGKNQ